jgi:hypothetical protein
VRLNKSDVAEASGPLHPLDEWYAHVFSLSPQKSAIFMHAGTGFVFSLLTVAGAVERY